MTGRTWLIVALALSLLVNMAALGAGVRLWRLRQSADDFGTAAASLPRDMRRELGAALLAHRADIAPALAEVQAARAAAAAAAQAEPYDRAQTEAALNRLRQAVDHLMQQAQGVVLDRLDRLDQR